MVTPRWLDVPVRPVAVRDVLAYLVAAVESDAGGVVDVGAEPRTFREMIEGYARARGLPRPRIVPLPVLAPHLAAVWIGLVTPIPNTLAVPIVEGMTAPIVGDVSRALALFPRIVPMPYEEAVALALERVRTGEVETRWSGAQGHASTTELVDAEGLVRDVRTVHVRASPHAVFATLTQLGGARGWPAWDFAWGARGAVDRLLGGPGRQRGRRHPTELLPGEAVDFWRVERVERDRLLRLRAEMRVPGRAWLQFEVRPEEGGARLVQTAVFAPRGLGGALYWYGLYLVHVRIFRGMVDTLRRRAEAHREPLALPGAPARA